MTHSALLRGIAQAVTRVDRRQAVRVLRHPVFALREFMAILSFTRHDVEPHELLQAILSSHYVQYSQLRHHLESARNSRTMQDTFGELRRFEAGNQDATGMTGGSSGDDYAIVHTLVRVTKPRVVVETGVAAGISTTAILDALELNEHGKLYSIDLPSELASGTTMADGLRYDKAFTNGRTSGWIVPEALKTSGRWALLQGDVREVLPSLLSDLESIDLFLHDDLHTPGHMLWEFNLVWPRLSGGGILASDDVNYGWTDFLEKIGVPRTSRWLNHDFFSAIRKPE